MNAKKPGLGRRIAGWAAIALFLALILAMLVGRIEHRSGLALGALLVMLALLLTLGMLGRRRAARDARFAEQVAKVRADMEAKGLVRRPPGREP